MSLIDALNWSRVEAVLRLAWIAAFQVVVQGCSGNASDAPRRYVVGISAPVGETADTYLFATATLDGDIFDRSKAIQLDDCLPIAGARPDTAFAIEHARISELLLQDDNSLRLGRVLDLTEIGIPDRLGGVRYGANAIVSPTKAYHVNPWHPHEVIVWNPDTMAVTTVVASGLSLSPDGIAFEFVGHPIGVGTKLLIVGSRVGQQGEATTTSIVAVDTTHDSVEMVEDSRCSGFHSFATAGDGATYFASSEGHAGRYLGTPELAPHPPCMLRILPGETSFDPTWMRLLTERPWSSSLDWNCPGSQRWTIASSVPRRREHACRAR